MTAFFDRLGERIDRADSVVSVGLDADPDRIPEFLADRDLPRWAFNRRIIDATHEHAACYKPNAAFYEDADGWRALRETVAYAHGKDVPVLLDAKRADIGNTSRRYADLLDDVDAITVNPYMGRDSLDPFLSRDDAGVFVLCRTSNPGGEWRRSRICGTNTATSAWSSARRHPRNWRRSGPKSPISPSWFPASEHRAATPRLQSSTAWPTASVSSTPRAASSSPVRRPPETTRRRTSVRRARRRSDCRHASTGTAETGQALICVPPAQFEHNPVPRS